MTFVANLRGMRATHHVYVYLFLIVIVHLLLGFTAEPIRSICTFEAARPESLEGLLPPVLALLALCARGACGGLPLVGWPARLFALLVKADAAGMCNAASLGVHISGCLLPLTLKPISTVDRRNVLVPRPLPAPSPSLSRPPRSTGDVVAS